MSLPKGLSPLLFYMFKGNCVEILWGIFNRSIRLLSAVLYSLSQSGETGDVPVHPYGEVLVVFRICAAAFSKAPEPGLMGGVIPVTFNRVAFS